MGQVSVSICGRSYRIACEDGQEDHLRTLAGRIDASIDDLRETFGEIGDQRLIVMSAITLADRVNDLEARLEDTRRELADAVAARSEAGAQQSAGEAELVRVVETVAERIETLAVDIGGLDLGEARAR